MVVTTAANDVECGDGSETRTCVVLGGRGFLGRSLVTRLLRLGGWFVRIADSSTQSLQLDPSAASDSILSSALSTGRASFCHVDVRDTSQIIKVTEGADVVFYMERTDLDTRNIYNCYMIIVQGAKNVISACQECKVRRLIYNSSADVVFDGSKDILIADESFSCPGKFPDVLIDFNLHAEGLIRLANNIDGLVTCVLRPSNAFGPGDTWFVPLLVDLAKSGLSKFITGRGKNMSDFTYAENVAHAHICAAETLDSQIVSVAGKAFFITNLEPMMFWEFASMILQGLGYPRPFIKVPTWMVAYILSLLQHIHEKSHFKINKYSPHYIIQLASRTRTFDCSAAQKHLGYSPVIYLEDGVKSTIASFSHLAKGSLFMRHKNFKEQSKAMKLLGSGIVADVLLWRNVKRTILCFLTLASLFYWFFYCGRTFTSSVAKLLLLVTVILYGYGILSAKIRFFAVKRISSSCFEIPESSVKSSLRSVSYMWNRGARHIKSLSKGEDWSRFIKLTIFLYILKWMLEYSLVVFVSSVVVFAFTAFVVYEQHEPVIDGLGLVLLYGIMASKELVRRSLPTPTASSHQR
ncbi:reticulon 20 [Hibiscus trionum]|uniref:Reticulon-like protein n=1 Tax=Hibiscus trionum TaxID=183268 RepID=A0A9W7M742_HIBTR|nr:reticulon 20 [Hibiscus trionum]